MFILKLDFQLWQQHYFSSLLNLQILYKFHYHDLRQYWIHLYHWAIYTIPLSQPIATSVNGCGGEQTNHLPPTPTQGFFFFTKLFHTALSHYQCVLSRHTQLRERSPINHPLLCLLRVPSYVHLPNLDQPFFLSDHKITLPNKCFGLGDMQHRKVNTTIGRKGEVL
jgi:hypothetical protein